ncbi:MULTISPECIES: metal ABC transporter solute-binding protein, Zn/Mn family [unclassified Ectothiorhodospira]|uniref:metal ABC transporter solute-binding protein, Zn/Mn family n=1 Tax=unclassified Ectothiorhodospira TaxID=2684909 RepID=UPI001EE8F3C9|nr:MULTISPECIES: zinc ABC transporter substrate-binding protein [unclassified Ectothiorhodospira]MCG5515322.1 zinc ABC transporter substrate-binding protein [Ectothiorhodospira sp. 9100]MCG5519397.1 zinc ABC transporter substrate-binding protein [Ectothiorhodospira sp. 9905]
MGYIRIVVLLVLALGAVSPLAANEALRVVATFSVLGDLAQRVAGEDARVDVLTPVGAEVHDWELTPDNFKALEKADLVLYNGYMLEQWMGQVRATTVRDTPVVAVAEQSGVETQPIMVGDFEGDPDPHLWMDPRNAAAYGHVIAQALGAVDPQRSEAFTARAQALEADLEALHKEIQEALSVIPEGHRLLVTSEAAFIYFGAAYDLRHDGIWGNNAETEGSPRQIMRVVDRVREQSPKAIFWESTISDRHVRSVAEDAGVTVAGPLYVDSVGQPGSGAGDYFAMMRHNKVLLKDHLGGGRDE